MPFGSFSYTDTTDANCIYKLWSLQWSFRLHWRHIVLFVLVVILGTCPLQVCAHKCTHAHPLVYKHAHTFTMSASCNSYGGSVYLAYVMGRLIEGFSNYEPGKASGRGRQSDPSLLVWYISRAPTTADPIHMAINGALYINVIPVLPHISAWITPTTNYSNAMFYRVHRCCGCKSYHPM